MVLPVRCPRCRNENFACEHRTLHTCTEYTVVQELRSNIEPLNAASGLMTADCGSRSCPTINTSEFEILVLKGPGDRTFRRWDNDKQTQGTRPTGREKAKMRRERWRACAPVGSEESFEMVPVTLWSLCRAPGLLGLLSVDGVSVVSLGAPRIQSAREERESGHGHRLESPCVRSPHAHRGHLLEGSGR